MEMKGMMFAAGGLTLAMTATTIMMSGDVTRMREQEQAKRAKECAAMTAAAPADPAVAGAIDDISSASGEATPEGDAAKGCPAPTGAAGETSSTTTDQAMVDPATGLPYEGTDGAGIDGYAPTNEQAGEGYAQEDPAAYDEGTSYPDDTASTTTDGSLSNMDGVAGDSESYVDETETATTAGF